MRLVWRLTALLVTAAFSVLVVQRIIKRLYDKKHVYYSLSDPQE